MSLGFMFLGLCPINIFIFSLRNLFIAELSFISEPLTENPRLFNNSVSMDFNLNPSTCALNGGEDYELLFTVKQKDFEEISKNAKLTIIGHITKKESGFNLIGHGDTSIPIISQGWSHI